MPDKASVIGFIVFVILVLCFFSIGPACLGVGLSKYPDMNSPEAKADTENNKLVIVGGVFVAIEIIIIGIVIKNWPRS